MDDFTILVHVWWGFVETDFVEIAIINEVAREWLDRFR